MKYKVSYTLNAPSQIGYHYEYFKTKASASQWLKENKARIYWHQLSETNPRSRKPRLIIYDDLASAGYVKKTGRLEQYYEIGMECLGLVFYQDGFHGPPNPDFNESHPESKRNFRFFSSYDGIIFIKSGHVLEFQDGTKVGMAKDREFAKSDAYQLSFYPQGYTKHEWLDLFMSETVRVTLWEKRKDIGGE